MGCKAAMSAMVLLAVVVCTFPAIVSATSCSDEACAEEYECRACAETECATCLQTDVERGEARSQSVMKNAIVEAVKVSSIVVMRMSTACMAALDRST